MRQRSIVLVVGSINIDVSTTIERFPQPGETLFGSNAMLALGGKGANQAVAARLCGARTHFVGRVGDDDFGKIALNGLRERGVEVEHLRQLKGAATGIATIWVVTGANNSIVVAPGANGDLTPEAIHELEWLFESVGAVVVQCEIPIETVGATIDVAHKFDTPAILNPAPATHVDVKSLGAEVSYLIPNETEASQLAGRSLFTPSDFGDWGVQVCSHGVGCVIVTLGASGCLLADRDGWQQHPGHLVEAIDTTGAGDAFVGCFAASIALGRDRATSVRHALLYSALSTTRRGAQSSYATESEFQAALSDFTSKVNSSGRVAS
jgi:ribokinase